MRTLLLAWAASVVLTACGSAGAPGSGVPVDSTVEPAGDPQVAAVYEDVEYYGACGNEVATVDGIRYYPLLPDERNALDPASYPTNRNGLTVSGLLVAFASAIPVVAPPGPGDDVGTMLVYSDGLARFESDSGWIIWLTTVEQQYGWEC